MLDYIMRPKITNLKRAGKIVEVDIGGSEFRILLTPFVEGIMGSTEEHTLVTLLQEPWYSYPFVLPLAYYVKVEYIWEKMYRLDKSKKEEAERLFYLLKKINPESVK